MAKRSRKTKAFVGVANHGGWAVLVTAAPDGTLLDRRRVELVDAALPKIPHHVQCQALPLGEGVALVERVRASAQAVTPRVLGALAAEVATPIAALAMRRYPPLPPTVAECITDTRARNLADWVMYCDVLAEAATALGWAVHRFNVKTVFADAARALGRNSLDGLLQQTRSAVGSPWTKDHQMALAAAIVAAHEG
jgi:hypothetical protein